VAISTVEHQGRVVYFVTTLKEFEDLAKKGEVVYLHDENKILTQVDDPEIVGFLYRAKRSLPNTRLYDRR
jgi:hypothetical protein